MNSLLLALLMALMVSSRILDHNPYGHAIPQSNGLIHEGATIEQSEQQHQSDDDDDDDDDDEYQDICEKGGYKYCADRYDDEMYECFDDQECIDDAEEEHYECREIVREADCHHHFSSSKGSGNETTDGVVQVKSQKVLSASSGDDIGSQLTSPIKNGLGQITVSSTITAIVLIITGLVFVFFGHKLFKPILFIAGFYVFSLLAYIVLANIEASQGQQLFGSNRNVVFLVIAIIAGLIGGFLFSFLWRVGLSAIGALLGFTLGTFILGLVSHGAISSGTGRIIFLVVLALVGAILIHFLERPILILGTAFPGAYAVFFGIDTFAGTGFNVAATAFLSGKGDTYETSGAVYGMIAGVLVLAVLGSALQWSSGRDSRTYRERSGYSKA